MGRKKPKPSPSPAAEPTPPEPLAVTEAVRFTRDVKRMAKRGADLARLRDMVVRLANRQPLEPRHVAPDWVLIYQTTETELILHATGTHSDLFG